LADNAVAFTFCILLDLGTFTYHRALHAIHRLLPLMPAAALAAASFSLRSRSSLRFITRVRTTNIAHAHNKHRSNSKNKKKSIETQCKKPLGLLLYRATNRFPQKLPAGADRGRYSCT
jgi:hypothetical protein